MLPLAVPVLRLPFSLPLKLPALRLPLRLPLAVPALPLPLTLPLTLPALRLPFPLPFKLPGLPLPLMLPLPLPRLPFPLALPLKLPALAGTAEARRATAAVAISSGLIIMILPPPNKPGFYGTGSRRQKSERMRSSRDFRTKEILSRNAGEVGTWYEWLLSCLFG